ncbi:pyruvate kinase alpha/beta domain-containing protein [Escherichia coli]
MTESGRTALMTSRISSGLPIFAMSRHERTLNRYCSSWRYAGAL